MFPHRKYSLQDAKPKIMAYCAKQERCHYDVEKKLRDWGVDVSHRNDLIVFLIENNFLNEERFARAYARGKFKIKHWGKRKIEKGLFQKQISGHCLKAAFEEIDEVEYKKTLDRLFEKKWLSVAGNNIFARKSKVRSYLIQKGFESVLIDEKLKSK